MSDFQSRLLLLFFLWYFGYVGGEDNLWCYECNTKLSIEKGQAHECNDPYAPGPAVDLVQCPKNESHHCLKSTILYNFHLVTVRGCIASKQIESYCDFEGEFPDAKINCLYCSEYACNFSNSLSKNLSIILPLLTIIIWKYYAN